MVRPRTDPSMVRCWRTVTDAIDGSPANLSTQLDKGWSSSTHSDWVAVQAVGTGISAAIASQIEGSGNVKATTAQVDQASGSERRPAIDLSRVRRPHLYVHQVRGRGVLAGQPALRRQPLRRQAKDAAAAGFGALMAANDAAWAALWSGRIDVLGDPALGVRGQRQRVLPVVEYPRRGRLEHLARWALLERLQRPHLLGCRYLDVPGIAGATPGPGVRDERLSVPAGSTPRSSTPSPPVTAGPGIHGRAPSPERSRSRHQRRCSPRGSTSSTSPPMSPSPNGSTTWPPVERGWLARYGWPVLSQAAAFWASRVSLGPDGNYHIDGVTGPDEEHPDVNDEAYTNVAAKTDLGRRHQGCPRAGTGVLPSSWVVHSVEDRGARGPRHGHRSGVLGI